MSTMCVLPWIHLNIDPDGKAYPCCITTPFHDPVGNVKKQSLESIWNGSKMKKIRLQMLNGEQPEICTRCFQREKSSGVSNRTFINNDFAYELKKARLVTESDGSAPFNLKYWDFRFSNLCNYKCRSCGPTYSSAWIPDMRKLTQKPLNDKVLGLEQIDLLPNKSFIDKHIHEVERIYFAGGEPLMMDEHWYILEQLTKHKRNNVYVTYNTNLSRLQYKNHYAIDYWKDLQKVELWPSIDEIGERAEIIRSGTKWSNVDKNLKTVIQLENVVIRPSITVSCMNVFRVTHILEYFRSLGLNKFSINMVNTPSTYHVSALPDYLRLKAKEDIQRYALLHGIPVGMFKELFAHLDQPFNIANAFKFVQLSTRLNEIRNEDIFKTVPELNEVKACFIV